MGFLLGDPERAIQTGFNLRDELSRNSSFLFEGVFPPPDEIPEPGMAYYSRARGAEMLGFIFAARAKNGQYHIDSRYGRLAPAVDPEGKPYGGRPEAANIFDPATRAYLLDEVSEHVKVRIGSPMGKQTALWGLANEWEGYPDYSEAARAEFIVWLEQAYGGDITKLNQAWGADFTNFADVSAQQPPTRKTYATNPGLTLDWWEFQSESMVRFQAKLTQAMYEADPQKRGVVNKTTQQTIEMPEANRERTFDQALFADLIRPYSGGYYGADMYGSGDKHAYELDYLYNCIRPEDGAPNFGVFLPEANSHGEDGSQFLSTFYRALGNGLKAVNYFTMGFPGAKGDWHRWSFLDTVSGSPKEKLYQAARWANMLHRTEAFWTESIPTAVPKVAILVPRRDILLSAASSSRRAAGKWNYPENHRWMIYRWLRENGYWVDVIPYTKLTPKWLKQYDALLLIGADHLSTSECEAVTGFTESGGLLVTDTLVGRYGARHLREDGLKDVLGFVPEPSAVNGKISFDHDHMTLDASGRVEASPPDNASVLGANEAAEALVWHRAYGEGGVLYFPFKLGSLMSEKPAKAREGMLAPDGPTADREEYLSFSGEFVIGKWLTYLLTSCGVEPAYQVEGHTIEDRHKLRVEQPYTDGQGNYAVVVANRGLSEPEIIAPSRLNLPLPSGEWGAVLWGSAENSQLEPVAVHAVSDGRYEVELPEVTSAGVLYLLTDHPPLLGIAASGPGASSKDSQTVLAKPGMAITVDVQLFNTTSDKLQEGELRLEVPAGWTVEQTNVTTSALSVGESASFTFIVTPDAEHVRMRPGWLYPVVATWCDQGKRCAVATIHSESAPDPSKVLHLLSGNQSYPSNYPYRTDVQADYRYLTPESVDIADPEKSGFGSNAGQALLNSFASPTGTRESYPYWWGNLKHHVRYRTDEVSIVFDLKAEREIRRVNIVRGPGTVYPELIRIAVSADGAEFTEVAVLRPEQPAREYVTGLFFAEGRFVQIESIWSGEEGALDEIEIWGN
ncbi:beta-galactosidase [Cerasicoccus frondis]|uniref:beta-galactosidase n=1 Tax=Cerasicoccus frondis TaxID=490090 RepID=UPI0028524E05|nr:beta-galactosidase [Cerasicoccus frondis]